MSRMYTISAALKEQGPMGQRRDGAEKRELTFRQLEPARLSKPERFVVIASSYKQTSSKLPDGQTT